MPGARKSSAAALVRKVPKKKRAKYGMTKPMKTAVQKLIDTNLETKHRCEFGFGGSGSNYSDHAFSYQPQYVVAVGGHRDLMKLVPAISQGTGSSERLGDKVNLQSLRCRFHFSVNPRIASEWQNGLFQCRLLVISCKKLVKYADLVGNWTSGLALKNDLLKPLGEGENFKGDPYSLNWPVNRDLFTCHADRRFVLGRGAANGDDTSDIHLPAPLKVVNVNLKVKSKTLRYTEDATTGATNYAPFGILLIAANYSPVTSGTSVSPVTGNVSSCISWQD